MPVLHRVREYTKRRGSSVREHLRGSGSKASRFKGASDSAKMSIKERLAREKADAADRKSQAQQEKRLKEGIYADEKAIVAREKSAARLKKIEADARMKARQGGFLTRGFNSLLAEARKPENRKKLRKASGVD